MSQSFAVECPFCHASGELADSRLLGQPIACPACQKVFVVAPTAAAPTATPIPPVTSIVSVPVPNAISPAAAEPAEPTFALGLPDAAPRLAVRPERSGSKFLATLAWSSISCTVLVWAIMFAMGDRTPKKPRQNVVKKETGSKKRTPPQTSDWPVADTTTQSQQPNDSAMQPTTPQGVSPEPGAESPANITLEMAHKLNDDFSLEVTPFLIESLAHSHAGVREVAAKKLARRNASPAVVAPLLKLLTDSAPSVRDAAVTALARHGKDSSEVIDPLGRLLQSDPVPNVRLSATNTLSLVGSSSPRAAAVAQVLAAALGHCKDEDVDSIAKALWPLGEAAKPAIPELLKHFKKEKWNVTLAGTLAQLGQFDELGPIIADSGEGTVAAKIGIAEGIGRQRAMSGASMEILQTLFKDSDKQVRLNAINALRTAEPKLPQAVELLELAKKDVDAQVRTTAEKTLATFPEDPTRTIVALLKQLANAEPDDTEKLVKRIGRTKDGVPSVVRLLTNPATDPKIQEAAAQVLDEYTDSDFRFDDQAPAVWTIAEDAQRSLSVRTRCAMFVKRRKIHSGQIAQILGDAITSESLPMDLRQKAVDAIPRDGSSILPTLIAAAARCEEPLPADATEKAKSSRNEFHRSLLSGIVYQSRFRSEPAAALPRLIGAIEKCEADIKIAALKALAELRLNESQRLSAMPTIRSPLKDMDPRVRAAAAHALGRFGTAAADAAPDLMAMLQDKENSVVLSALVALSRVVPTDGTVMQELIRGLGQPELREDVVEALAEMGPAAASAVPNLRQLIPQADERLLSEILLALGRIGAAAKPAVPDLIAQLKHPKDYVRSCAAKSLGQLQEHAAEAIPVLVQMLGENEQTQEMAVNAFRQMGAAAKEVVAELEKLATTTQSARVKIRIESALASIALDLSDPDSAVIMVLLNDDEWFATMNSQPKDPATMLPALGRTVHNSRDIVRQRSWDWLGKLRHIEPERQIYLNMLESDDPSQQATAAVLLERLPIRGDRTLIAGAIGRWTQFPQGRKDAIELLVKLGRPAMPAVANVLLDEKCSLHERTEILYIIQGYHELDRTWLLPLLRPGLKSESAAVRQSAAYSLAFLNPREPDIVPEFLEFFQNRAAESWSEMHVLREMAIVEADLSNAVPVLMKLIEPAVKRPDGDEKQVSRFYHEMGHAAEVLSRIGPRSEDASLFRQLLRSATDAPKEEDDDKSDSQHHRDRLAESALHLLAVLGPQAAVTVPEIKAQLVTGLGGKRYDWASTLLKLGDPAIEAAVEVARQADAPLEARLRAFHVLHVLSDFDQRGVLAVRELLQDPVHSLQVQAAAVLVEYEAHRQAALPVLSDALRSGKEVSYEALVQFRKYAPAAEVLPVLLHYAQQPNEHMFETAIEALLQIAPENPDVRAAALNGMKAKQVHSLQLTKCWEPLIPDLIQAVEQDRGTWRQQAAQFLGDFKTPAIAAIPALRRLMEQDSRTDGDAAAVSLATIDPDADDAAARVCSLYMKTGDPSYRLLNSLERLGPKAAPIIPKLLELLRANSAWGETYPLVGTLGEAAKPTLPLVIKELGDYREGSFAHSTIKTLGEHAADVGPELIAALLNGNGSKFGPGLLEKMGEPARKAVAEMCLDLQNDEKRFQTVVRLRVFGVLAEPATSELIAYTREGNPALRIAAINVLAEIELRAAESVPVLAGALSDPDPRVAVAAISALTQLSEHATPALPQVLAELERNRHSTAEPLLELFRKMGTAANDAIPALEQLKKSPNIATSLTARAALKKIKEPYSRD